MELVQQIMVRSMALSVMLAVGLELTFPQLRDVLRRPLLVGTGLVHNLILVPLVALGVGLGLGIEGDLLAVLVLAAGAPGGPLGALLTHLVRGTTAYAVVLIFLMASLSTVTVPLFLPRLLPAAEGSGEGIAGTVLMTLALFQLLPLLSAMALRNFRPALAERARPWIQNATKTLFVVVSVGMALANLHLFRAVGARLITAQTLIVIFAVVGGFLLAWGGRANRRGLAMTSGINNIALAFLLVKSIDSIDDDAILVALTYSLMMVLVTASTALGFGLRDRRAGRAQSVTSAERETAAGEQGDESSLVSASRAET